MEKETSQKESNWWLETLRADLVTIDDGIHDLIGKSSRFPISKDNSTTPIFELIASLRFRKGEGKRLKADLRRAVLERMNIITKVGIVKSRYKKEIFQPEVELKIQEGILEKAKREDWDLNRRSFTLQFQECLANLAKSSQSKIVPFHPQYSNILSPPAAA